MWTHDGVRPELPGLHGTDERPALAPDLSEDEFLRWYWLKDELQAFARVLSVSPGGSKTLLTERVAAALGGRALPPSPPVRPRASMRLSADLDEDTIVPAGQPCSQEVRAWLSSRLGPRFAFDAPMRAFFATADGTTTLGDAVAHWHASRDRDPSEIGAQFEWNRFTRRWSADHPDGTAEQMRAAWARYRSLPLGARDRA
ncbi:DUF6434 domain-containing protein [Aeromicrobium massiliense]|uniref:DUF6434 domain-containing protein n=1 Tax=Aeromicrobium massiliense TaxID=1464554 RepID=UPI0002D7E670|nr:DUF6434 domain-containing protein [Aeromicrobium massiliense]